MDDWIQSLQQDLHFVPAWAFWTGFLVAAICLRLAVHRIVYLIFERRLRDSQWTAWLLVSRETKGPTAIAVIIMTLSIGLQIARLEGEVVEEITSTYVIVALWGWRRMVLPLSYSMSISRPRLHGSGARCRRPSNPRRYGTDGWSICRSPTPPAIDSIARLDERENSRELLGPEMRDSRETDRVHAT